MCHLLQARRDGTQTGPPTARPRCLASAYTALLGENPTIMQAMLFRGSYRQEVIAEMKKDMYTGYIITLKEDHQRGIQYGP
ncbi:unnamed protein product [Nezara viridula]|uniref:Uncharacterized protein n=1 Tax=Nezara viridula TaxID=85310 RepID=A0A9P0ED23_NEZVI|nr:unnamed protein product [Nezara viridula]